MKRFYGFEIIDVVPIALHLSLFLFAAGLVTYLWQVSLVVSLLVLGVFGVAALFYTITTILAAIMDETPFVTRASRYLRPLMIRIGWYSELESNTKYHFDTLGSNRQNSTTTISSLLWIRDKAGDSVADPLIEAIGVMHFDWKMKSAFENRLQRCYPPEMVEWTQDDSESAPPFFLKSLQYGTGDSTKDQAHESVTLVIMVRRRLADIIRHPHQVTPGGGANIGDCAEALASLCTYISRQSVGWSDWREAKTVSTTLVSVGGCLTTG